MVTASLTLRSHRLADALWSCAFLLARLQKETLRRGPESANNEFADDISRVAGEGSTMIIPKSLPKIKQFFSGVCHRPFVVAYATRLIAGFLDHHGRMSAGQAAGSVASLSRHPAAIGRFLDRYGGWLWSMRKRLSDRLLEAAGNAAGVFVFILDATDVTQQGIKTDNTFSTGNRKPRTAQSPRYSKRRVARRSCHRHVMGLLLTPSGVRIPYYLPYYTRDYCQAKGLPYRTQADLGGASSSVC